MIPALFHYPTSPYSEKLRLAMGMTGASWASIEVAPQPPREALHQLLGGYRRIPVLQMGAHFYCDTRLAFESLYAEDPGCTDLTADDETLRDSAEREIFFAVFSVVSPVRVARFLYRRFGVAGVWRFVRDRTRMMRDSKVRVLPPERAREVVQEFIAGLALSLSSRRYLSGVAPGYLDLCCYHPLWMASQIDVGLLSSWPPSVLQWMERINSLGHGERLVGAWERVFFDISQDQEVFSGTVTEPYHVGEFVGVAPSDYARDETCGGLVHIDQRRVVIARTLQSGDVVYLHFPRSGLDLRRL